MDKNIIKHHLTKRFISEETTPGISVTDKAKKESEKINKAGVKAIGKDVSSYEKALKQTNPDMGKMAKNKYNYTDDAEKTYHDEMEILNGQEMIQYTSEPGSEFKARAEEGIEGSSRMGNKGGEGMGNAEETWGASKDSFGKDLVKRVKDSSKKRADAEIQTYGMGDVQIPTGNKVQVATTAVGAGKPKGDTTKASQSASEKTKIKTVKENNNNTKIKESMKRITFKKEFNGSNTTQKLGHALTLIPEGYRVDKKEFEMTDGTVSCKVRWEGNLSEGKAVILQAADKTKINEDMNRMKQLMGYNSSNTLGLVKGNARLDENAAFADIWKKSRVLLGESEDIESEKPATGDLDDAVSVAPEAKKHVEGSVSTDKGTKAPAPKKGELDKISVPQAAEAKKHVEGSVASVKKTEAPAPKVGEWDEISVPQAAEAKKHIQTGTATHKATNTPKTGEWDKINENEEIDEPEEEDTFLKPSDDDASFDEKEPSSSEIKGIDAPALDNDDEDGISIPAPKGGAKLMVSQSTGSHYIMAGKNAILVTPNFVELAKKNKGNPAMLQSIITKMQDEANFAPETEDDDLDEGLFGGNDKAKAAKELEFDQLNSKLVGTKIDQTANKAKWLDRAKQDNYRGRFILNKGILNYDSKPLVPSTGGSSGFGTTNENEK